MLCSRRLILPILLSVLFFYSCKKTILNGHYHVEWDNRTSFQTWNIKENRVRINDSVCNDKKQICYGKPIKFKGDSIFIPWVDFIYKAKYKIENDGTILTTTNYNNKHDTLKLIPKKNCIDSKDYLNEKVITFKNNFDLVSLYYNSHGESDFPKNSPNELIIGKKNGIPYYILNDKVLQFSENKFNIGKPTTSRDIWIYIDNKIHLKEVLSILMELNYLGYKIYFASKDDRENNEQVIIFKKSITSIDKKSNSTIINTCEYCDKHPTKKIDSILKFKIFKKDSCLVNNEITDYFQLRNSIVRFLKKNRSTRLKTQLQFEINSNILFEEYLYLLGDIDFVNKELLGTYYRDTTDVDFEYISNKQNSYNRKNLKLEFPLRIEEVIYPF